MKMKGQGSLEYLIIIAAVLAIAAIVVLFLTGAFTGATSTGDLSMCKDTASKCATQLATSALEECSTSFCEPCDDLVNFAVSTGCVKDDGTPLFANPLEACQSGRPDCIVSA